MKYLLHRLTALLLAGLLLLSAGAELVFAAQPGADPACELGTSSWNMLSGGGRLVRTETDLFYVDDAGDVRAKSSGALICAGPAAKLNYADGVLYFARMEEGIFDLCALDLERGEERCLLENFSGELGQLYLVEGEALQFSCDNALWQLDLDTGEYRLILFALELRSFVPTACGPVYATGSLFDCSLYAGGCLLAEHVVSYYVDFDVAEGVIFYNQAGEDRQIDLAAAFRGQLLPVEFDGVEMVSLSATQRTLPSRAELQAEYEAEMARLEQERAELTELPENQPDPEPAPPDPAEADPYDPQLPEEILEQLQEEPEAPETSEPVDAEEPAPLEAPAEEPIPTEAPVEEPIPTEAPVEEPIPAEVPAQEPIPTEAPAEEPLPTEAPAETPATQPAAPVPAQETEAAAAAPLDPAGREQQAAPTVTGDEILPVKLLPQVVTKLYPNNTKTASRPPISLGQENIVRRARQMLNIRWTLVKTIYGYGGRTYAAGVTYTGLPYAQSRIYVPWSASLSAFRDACMDPNSRMYTGNQGYGTDCSAFVSWAWGLKQRTLNNNQAGMAAAGYSTRIGGGYSGAAEDYTKIQIGDALIREDSGWSHSRLVTDVTYYSDGSIRAIEVSEAANAERGCISTVYSGTSLLNLLNGYGIYRSRTRDSVSYAHDCAVPLEGDVCPYCGLDSGEMPELQYILPGVDVSYAQGTVSWATLSNQISFAILRAGYRGWSDELPTGTVGKDTQFDSNLEGCEANGIPYGLYFYAGALTPEQAKEEAEALLEYLGDHKPELPIFYDVEETRNILKLPDEELLEVIRAFCETIEAAGFKAGVYASTSIWNQRLTHQDYDKWVRWAAQWESEKMSASNGANVWQFDNKGTLAGVSVDVDLDYWLGTLGDIEQLNSAIIMPATCTIPGVLLCVPAQETELVMPDEMPIMPLGHVFTSRGQCARCGERKPFDMPFTDVKQGSWYEESVRFVTENSLFNGTSDTSFSPAETMTRAMMVTVLHRLAGKPKAAAEAPFTDLKDGGYYVKAVNWGFANKIVSGVSDTSFAPGSEITREQTAAFFYRYLLSLNPETLSFEDLDSFPDADQVSSYARKALSWAVGAGIVKGSNVDGQSFLLPKNNATRAEVATMFMRFAEYLEKRSLWEGK